MIVPIDLDPVAFTLGDIPVRWLVAIRRPRRLPRLADARP